MNFAAKLLAKLLIVKLQFRNWLAACPSPSNLLTPLTLHQMDTLTEDDLALCLGALTTPQQLSVATAVCWRWCRLARGRSLLLRLLFTQAEELSLKERNRPIYLPPMCNEAGYSNDEELQPPFSKWGELYPELQPLVDAHKALGKGEKKDAVVSFPSTFVLVKMLTSEGDVVACHATRAALRVLLKKRSMDKDDGGGCDAMEMLIEGVTMSAGWQEQNLVAHVLFINTERERAFSVTPLQGLKMSEGLPNHDDADYCLRDWEAALVKDESIVDGQGMERSFLKALESRMKYQQKLRKAAEQAVKDKKNIYFGVDQEAHLIGDPDDEYGVHAVINVQRVNDTQASIRLMAASASQAGVCSADTAEIWANILQQRGLLAMPDASGRQEAAERLTAT